MFLKYRSPKINYQNAKLSKTIFYSMSNFINSELFVINHPIFIFDQNIENVETLMPILHHLLLFLNPHILCSVKLKVYEYYFLIFFVTSQMEIY